MRLAADDVAALARARDVLRLQLEASEPWRALRQLDEREARGDAVRSLDGQALRRFLETTLDKSCPGWRALSALGEAIEASDRWHQPVVVAPIAEQPAVPPTPTEPPAATLTVDTSAEPPPAMPASVVVVAPEPEAAPLTAAREPAPASPPPSPQPADLRRIRLIGRGPEPSPMVEAPKADRFGGVVPWARLGEPPPVPVEAPTVATEPAILHVPNVAPPRDWQDAAARAFTSTKVTAPAAPRVEPPRAPERPALTITEPDPALAAAEEAAVQIDLAPVRAGVAMPTADTAIRTADATGLERLERLEADLDEIVGDRTAAAGRRRVRRAGQDDDEEAALDVEEAEVLIVPVRPELAAPEPVTRDLVTSPPVALSIRLKETERQEEFDGAEYAAYRDDVEEAEVEIIRHGDDKRRSVLPSVPEPVPPKSGGPRRFLKGLSGE